VTIYTTPDDTHSLADPLVGRYETWIPAVTVDGTNGARVYKRADWYGGEP